MSPSTHQPPRDCPVCGDQLQITRLGCASCGSELAGQFSSCEYCALGEHDRQILRTFLVSRGNMRDLARDLGVSYPTARQRFADMLAKLGLEESPHPTADAEPEPSREAVLRRLATGELDLDEATALLNLTGAEMSARPGRFPDNTDGREDTP